MGRPKLNIVKAKQSGAADKNPSRYKGNVPKSQKPIGKAPARMKGAVRKIWDEICGTCVEGVLTSAERISLELACYLILEFRSNPTDFPSAKLTNLRGILGSFGMTPSDRQKLAFDDGDNEKGWGNI